ncbi:MAG TPA: NAD(P)/FAD-dependent oxidoreductase [Candidatus Dormibacteraeota bacterium]|nr:NAD(P)/FAD-dependent oxidoreductase [Candidatus Dormibacteraeota bacterium]
MGGGPAGLNAALMLGRSRRLAVLVDGGAGRNAASHAMHGYLSRDGLHPAELRRIGREQLQTYPTVDVLEAHVDEITGSAGHFTVHTSTGATLEARKLLLAPGIRDALPDVPGMQELYGVSVFHCFYCDGFEVSDQPLLVVGHGNSAYRQALMLLSWSRDIALCTLGVSDLSAEQRAHLASYAITVHEQRIERLETEAGRLVSVILGDGTALPRPVIFFHGATTIASALHEGLGCAMTDEGRIQVDEGHRTSVPGVFAAGDAARRSGQHPSTQVIFAAASGALAGIALHQELLHEDFGLTPALPAAPVLV